MYLFLDIETLPSAEKPTVESIKVPGTYKNPASILKYQEANVDKVHRKSALDCFTGRIFCISWALDNGAILTTTTDNPTVEFTTYLDKLTREELTNLKYVGHNIPFDWKFIITDIRRQELFIGNFLPQSIRSKHLVDTQKMAVLDTYGDFVSLDTLCKTFGIEGKGNMDGSKVYDAWLNEEYSKIREYCADDVYKLREIYKILTFKNK